MNQTPTFEPAPPATASHPSVDRVAILRRKQVENLMGHRRSTIYNRIQGGLMTRPVSLGGRTVGWPATEVATLNAARIAGWSDSEIRVLVAKLEAARTTFAEGL
jgi:prophage regulatory protein